MDTKTKPFDSFTAVYNILIWAGFYKRSYRQKSYVNLCQILYKIFAFAVVFGYNLANIIFIAQPSHAADLKIEGLMIEIPQINLISKLLTFTLYSSRVGKINEVLNDPIFAANGVEDEKYLLKNIKEMHHLSKIMNIFVTIAGLCWPASHVVQRLRDESTVIPFYVPFKTDTWLTYVFLCLIQVLPLLWVGYGHLALDCLVATYYAQAQVQLKIIKHNLKHLFDENNRTGDFYNEVTEKELYANFVYYVKRYEKLVWYITEVNRVFNPSMTFQFLTSSATMCIVIYKMSEIALSIFIEPYVKNFVKGWLKRKFAITSVVKQSAGRLKSQFSIITSTPCTPKAPLRPISINYLTAYYALITSVLSVEFLFLMALIAILLIQVFLYCYYGNLVRHESESMNTCLYESEWTSVSPRLRRTMLIAMARWSRPLTTRVVGVIPLALDTFISIIKFSYSLYTVLSTKHK